jgi:predicted DNA-binding protein
MVDTVRVHIRVPHEQYVKLMDESKKLGNGVSSVIRFAINEYFENKEIKKYER